jgi:hypothetical protein
MHHLYVRGDLKLRGMVNTFEGKFIAHAGPKLIGWGHEGHDKDLPPGVVPKRNPEFIIWDDGIAGNPAPNTWEFLIVRNDTNYEWANIAANNITAHDTINASHFKSRTSQPITVYSSVEPNSNGALDLGSNTKAFHEIFTQYLYSGYITTPMGLYTDAIGSTSNTDLIIRSYTNRKIVLDGNIQIKNTLLPNTADVLNLGSSTLYFNSTYTRYAYGKSGHTFGCERSKSGQVWQQDIQSEVSALEALTHEVTKTLYHVTYSDDVGDGIVCVCGKSVKQPCLEHVDEWNAKYCKNETLRSEASSFLLLEHATTIARLQTTIEEMAEKIRLLEEKISPTTKGEHVT